MNFTESFSEEWDEYDFFIPTMSEYFRAIKLLVLNKVKNYGTGYDKDRRISTDDETTAQQIREILKEN